MLGVFPKENGSQCMENQEVWRSPREKLFPVKASQQEGGLSVAASHREWKRPGREVGRTPRGSVAWLHTALHAFDTMTSLCQGKDPGWHFLWHPFYETSRCFPDFFQRYHLNSLWGNPRGRIVQGTSFDKRLLPLFVFKSSATGWVGTRVLFGSTQERPGHPHSRAMVTLGHAFSNPAALPAHYCKSPWSRLFALVRDQLRFWPSVFVGDPLSCL